MRKFETLCKDEKTGYQMILSECSYNEACFWLQGELDKCGWEVIGTETVGDYTAIYTEDASGKPAREFVYDESRGYLLSE